MFCTFFNADLADFVGTDPSYGHGTMGSLYLVKDGVWEMVEGGTSTYEDGNWEFGFGYEYSSGNDKAGDDGKDGAGGK